jgi:hypothetical protein
VRSIGEELLERLRTANTPGGLRMTAINWIVANLASHQFVEIVPAGGKLSGRCYTGRTRSPYVTAPLDPLPLEPKIH